MALLYNTGDQPPQSIYNVLIACETGEMSSEAIFTVTVDWPLTCTTFIKLNNTLGRSVTRILHFIKHTTVEYWLFKRQATIDKPYNAFVNEHIVQQMGSESWLDEVAVLY